jgi:hypothetical protein
VHKKGTQILQIGLIYTAQGLTAPVSDCDV